MALSEVSQNTTKSNDILKTNREEQLNSTSKVFCEACNQIAKDYFVNYNEANLFLPISIPFAKKVKTINIYIYNIKKFIFMKLY